MSAGASRRWILSMAELVSADQAEALRWYRCDPIAALEGRTAEALVRAGRGAAVVAFLAGVLGQERQAGSAAGEVRGPVRGGGGPRARIPRVG